MKLFLPSMAVMEGEGYSKDLFDRQPFGIALTNLVSEIEDALVIGLDAMWGEGKSTFVKMWQQQLKESDIHSIYIDAFANDHLEDGYFAVVSEINAYAQVNVKPSEAENIAKFRRQAAKVASSIFLWSLKTAIKFGTLGAINASDWEDLENVGGDISEDIAESISDRIEERMTEHQASAGALSVFREMIGELPKRLNPDNPKPLVIIIDELDRCRPSFALDIIEKIKHIFSVPGVVFLLVMHKPQLEASVRAIYGLEIDAPVYLQKFINIEVSLPKKTLEEGKISYLNFCKRLYKGHGFDALDPNKVAELPNIVAAVAINCDLSLRQIERTFTYLAILYSMTKNRFNNSATTVCVLKVIDSQLFGKIPKQEVSAEEAIARLNLEKLGENGEYHGELERIKDWLRFALLSDEQYNNLDREDSIRILSRQQFHYGKDRKETIVFLAKTIGFVE